MLKGSLDLFDIDTGGKREAPLKIPHGPLGDPTLMSSSLLDCLLLLLLHLFLVLDSRIQALRTRRPLLDVVSGTLDPAANEQRPCVGEFDHRLGFVVQARDLAFKDVLVGGLVDIEIGSEGLADMRVIAMAIGRRNLGSVVGQMGVIGREAEESLKIAKRR